MRGELGSGATSRRKTGADGRLSVSFRSPPSSELGPGIHAMALSGGGRAELLVPARDGRMPLVVMLHGAGGRAEQMISVLSDAAASHGLVVLAPQSRGPTWDLVRGGFGPDVLSIGEALDWVGHRLLLDPARVAIGGFSDGASYGLSLGLTNGDFFSDILAFSPGFAAPAHQQGQPHVFISHGRRDEVLPIERCGRPLAGQLRRAGYEVDYREFDDGHVLPRAMVEAAVARFLARE